MAGDWLGGAAVVSAHDCLCAAGPALSTQPRGRSRCTRLVVAGIAVCARKQWAGTGQVGAMGGNPQRHIPYRALSTPLSAPLWRAHTPARALGTWPSGATGRCQLHASQH